MNGKVILTLIIITLTVVWVLKQPKNNNFSGTANLISKSHSEKVQASKNSHNGSGIFNLNFSFPFFSKEDKKKH